MLTRYDRCQRCSVVVPWGRSTCRDCNPAGLPTPSPSQFGVGAILPVLGGIIAAALILTVIAQ
jgi:hypothetical protein